MPWGKAVNRNSEQFVMEVLFNLIVIRTSDMERSLQFYERLGLVFTQHRHGSGPEHFACESGQVIFEIYPKTSDIQDTSTVRIGFKVADLNDLIANLQKDGVTIISHPKHSPWGRRTVVDDPDGHRVELVENLNTQD